LEPSKGAHFLDKDYYAKVFNAIDLRSMEEKLRFGYYINLNLFFKDFKKIIRNCKLYNGLNHLISENCFNLEFLIQKLKKKEKLLKRKSKKILES